MDKATWSQYNWNAYVEAGKDRADRQARLAEVPEQWRLGVEQHVQIVFAIRKFNNRKTRERDGQSKRKHSPTVKNKAPWHYGN